MPKKKVDKNTEEITEVTETHTENTINTNMKTEETVNEEMQKPKVKKERSQKQKDAFAKAQIAIKAKREQVKENKEKGLIIKEKSIKQKEQEQGYINDKQLNNTPDTKDVKQSGSNDSGCEESEIEYVKKPKRKTKRKKIVIEQDSSSSDEEIVISRRRGRKKKVESQPIDIPHIEQKKEVDVEDLKPPEVQYTHKQLLEAFGL